MFDIVRKMQGRRGSVFSLVLPCCTVSGAQLLHSERWLLTELKSPKGGGTMTHIVYVKSSRMHGTPVGKGGRPKKF